jgi:hypothetical protein
MNEEAMAHWGLLRQNKQTNKQTNMKVMSRETRKTVMHGVLKI